MWINGWRWPTWNTVPAPYGAGKGQLTAEMWMSSNPDSWRVFDYDARGRVTQETVAIKQGVVFETNYTYDPLDRVATMTYPSNSDHLTYEYNEQGLPESLVSSVVETLVSSVDYDALGRVQERVLGNGSYRNTYDYYPWSLQTADSGRLHKIETGTLADPDSLQGLSYSYDAVGNIESTQDMANGGQRQCYEYDHAGNVSGIVTMFFPYQHQENHGLLCPRPSPSATMTSIA